LNDGRVGKVIRANRQKYTRPILEVWYPDQLHDEPQIADLSQEPELQVRRALPSLLPAHTIADLDHWD